MKNYCPSANSRYTDFMVFEQSAKPLVPIDLFADTVVRANIILAG